LNKLFATIKTILDFFTSLSGVFLFGTSFNMDVLVYHIAAMRAKTDQRVWATMIIVRAFSFLQYHISSQSLAVNSAEIALFYDSFLSRSFPQTQRHAGLSHWGSSTAPC
jgi:hypothetical protein